MHSQMSMRGWCLSGATAAHHHADQPSGLTCRITYFWIKEQLENEAKEKGIDTSKYASSTIVKTSMPTELGALRKADGEEGFDKQ